MTRTLILGTMLSACVPVTGEGISVRLLACTAPEFTLDSNYCAERFEVSGPEGQMWLVQAANTSGDELGAVCITELAVGLAYGGLVMSATASEPEELLHEETYTYEASFEGQVELPASWSGEFTYDCVTATGP